MTKASSIFFNETSLTGTSSCRQRWGQKSIDPGSPLLIQLTHFFQIKRITISLSKKSQFQIEVQKFGKKSKISWLSYFTLASLFCKAWDILEKSTFRKFPFLVELKLKSSFGMWLWSLGFLEQMSFVTHYLRFEYFFRLG